MKKFRIRLGEREKDILRIIGILGIFAIIAIAPNALLMFKGLTKKQKFYQKDNIKRRIRKLVQKDIIYLSGDCVKLTAKGKGLVKLIQVEDISKIPRSKKWDGSWHLVCYDIPNYKKSERNYFCLKLKKLGFVKIQESLWAFPFECQEEIAVLSQNLGISPYVAYLKTNKLPHNDNLIRKFKLS